MPADRSFSSEVLTVERDEDVATLWLDRAEARNAMGPSFFSDLPHAVAELSNDPAVRAVVIAARGPHFSVGLDLKALPSMLADDDAEGRPSTAARARAARLDVLRLQGAVNAVADCPKPIVACVHGYCIGGGVDLIAACDIRLASADAVFSVREAKIAIVADLGSLQRLPAIIGLGHVAELAYTGKDMGAGRAKEIGLVNDVLPDADAALGAAQALAAEIAANSPLAVQGTKQVLMAANRRSVAEGLEYVATWNAGMIASHDLGEALAAFLERRQPKFTGG
ncbi:MAG TPA: crotonase/enoyl-CoA hydratase family protein [Acidimicrobiales bacterium]|nr:crotonase/enoyl-CoA hydratase family protein [Acidimicrobiales bacterium]